MPDLRLSHKSAVALASVAAIVIIMCILNSVARRGPVPAPTPILTDEQELIFGTHVDTELAANQNPISIPLKPGDGGPPISEEEWLMMSQLPNGAITQSPGDERIIPYFANAAARVLVDIDPDRARSYITWYLSNLNLPDSWGLYGTIYDYRVKGSNLVPTGEYDSADSYAATFLSLVSYYYQKTGDGAFVLGNITRLSQVASVILNLQDKDGLVFVKPVSRTKYLMDNAENYRGLLDWADTMEALDRHEEADDYRRVASRIKEGIIGELYDPERQKYAWMVSWYGRRFPRAHVWYPDAVSQISLISNRVIDPKGQEATRIWTHFNQEFPKWEEGQKDDDYPWVEIALTAAGMNDTRKVQKFVDWVKATYIENHRPYPWHIQESSNIVRIMELMSTNEGGETGSTP